MVHGVAEGWTQLSAFTFTFHFHALEKEMATHSSVLGWRIPGMGGPDGLPSMGSHRVGHDWSDLAAAAANFSYPLDFSKSWATYTMTYIMIFSLSRVTHSYVAIAPHNLRHLFIVEAQMMDPDVTSGSSLLQRLKDPFPSSLLNTAKRLDLINKMWVDGDKWIFLSCLKIWY